MPRDAVAVSKNMSKIHSKDTSIELCLRKALWHKGYRYRKNYKALPGSPDIVLTKYKIAIFCDSEFFHGKDWEYLKLRLEKGNNPDYWIKKLNAIVHATGRMTKNCSSWDIPSSISGDRISKNILTNASRLSKKPSGTAKWHPSMTISCFLFRNPFYDLLHKRLIRLQILCNLPDTLPSPVLDDVPGHTRKYSYTLPPHGSSPGTPS